MRSITRVQNFKQIYCFNNKRITPQLKQFHNTSKKLSTFYENPTFVIDLNESDPPVEYNFENDRREFNSLQPEEIMKELDKYIVGQADAKRAVAVAMRNRWRRNNIADPELRKEIIPKNILMIGPTGVGKTEVARRMAKLAGAPFIKTEATKFTEVGFRGADVDSIIKDLVEIAIQLVKERETKKVNAVAKDRVDENILNLLLGPPVPTDKYAMSTRNDFRKQLKEGMLEDIDIDYEPKINKQMKPFKGQISGGNIKKIQQVFYSPAMMTHDVQKKKTYQIKDVRPLEIEAEIARLLPEDLIIKRAIKEAEEYGIVFLDELDKIAGNSARWHADASDEGVQRDLLPLIEGTKIQTDHGEVDTSRILFITAGAFHQSKPSDLLAELQGRLPIRVQLHGLTEEDMYRILTEPESHSIKQQRALLKTEGVDLRFTDDSIREMSRIAFEVNQSIENIGARRLFTVIEKVLEDVSFNASQHKGSIVIIDKEDVEQHMKQFREKSDLKQFIL